MENFENEQQKENESKVMADKKTNSREYENLFSSSAYRQKANSTLKKIEELANKRKQEEQMAQLRDRKTQEFLKTHNQGVNLSESATKHSRSESFLFQKIRERELQDKQQAESLQEVQETEEIRSEEVKENEQTIDETVEELKEISSDVPPILEEQKQSEDNVSVKDLSEILTDVNDIPQTAKPPVRPQKNYSFRIKLAFGVYVILVALFGGWIISNAVEIKSVNNQITEITDQNANYEADIAGLVKSIKDLNNSSQDDPSLSVSIITNVIDVTPEPLETPTEIKPQSNWFDAFCNWVSKLFGG